MPNRWSCRQYCQALIDAGYDVFAVEPRNQGDSDRDPNYESFTIEPGGVVV